MISAVTVWRRLYCSLSVTALQNPRVRAKLWLTAGQSAGQRASSRCSERPRWRQVPWNGVERQLQIGTWRQPGDGRHRVGPLVTSRRMLPGSPHLAESLLGWSRRQTRSVQGEAVGCRCKGGQGGGRGQGEGGGTGGRREGTQGSGASEKWLNVLQKQALCVRTYSANVRGQHGGYTRVNVLWADACIPSCERSPPSKGMRGEVGEHEMMGGLRCQCAAVCLGL